MRPSRRTRITIRMVGRYALGGWLLASVPAAVALAFFGSQFSGPSRAAMDCAQVARNIARGRGFTTNVLIPAALSRCERRAAFPDLANPPLHPAGLALAFALGNPRGQRASDNAAALWTLLWWFLVLGLSWALSARLFGLKPAIITVLALTWNVALLRSALAAEVVPPLAFATTALFFAMYEIGRIPADATRPARAIRRLGPILWGAIAGLCFLAEYTFLAVLLAVACFVLLPRDGDRWRRCLAAVVAFLVVTLPWLVRNERAVGDALASVRWYSVVNGMSDYAGGSFARSARPEPLPALVLADLGEYLRATLVRLGGLRDGILDSGDVFVVGLFIAAAFVPFGDATLNRVRVALYVAMVGVALAVALAGGGLGLTPFVPLINVIAVGFFLQHLEARRVGVRIRRGRRISSAFMRWVIICAGLALLSIPMLVQLRRGARLINWRAGPYERIARLVPSGATIVTDDPWKVAWRTDRRALLTPMTRDDLQSIERTIGPVEYSLFLSPRLSSNPDREDVLWLWLADGSQGRRLGYETVQTFPQAEPPFSLVLKKKSSETLASQ